MEVKLLSSITLNKFWFRKGVRRADIFDGSSRTVALGKLQYYP
jgi:hypothetical protein